MSEISPLLKILIVFAGILVLGRLKFPLALALLLGAAVFDFWGGNAPRQSLIHFGQALLQPDLWLLIAVTALTIEFGREMADQKNSAAMLALTRKFGGKSGRLWNLMLMPALIGLMPMPAGALFSAPLVQQNVPEPHWQPEWKTVVNYWFRHVWEYWWPIYPVVIIGIAVFKMDTWRFIATTIAFTPAAFGIGYWFLLRPHRRRLVSTEAAAASDLRLFFKLMWPLAVVIAFVLILPTFVAMLFPKLNPQTGRLMAMLIGVSCGLGIIWRRTRHQSLPAGGHGKMFTALFSRPNLNIMLTIGSIMVFQSLLESSRLLPAASQGMVQSGLSAVPLIALLPFLAGFVTGVAAGFAGIAFPLVVGLLAAGADGLTPMATLALAFGFGYMGMLLSPIHLCLIMTRDYFSAALLPTYRKLALCVAAQISFAVIAFVILRVLRL